MSRADRRLARFVKALLADRRPPRAPADDDAGAMRIAAQLRAAHPGGADPSPAFVDNLGRRLRGAGEHEHPTGWVDNGIQRRRFLVGGVTAVAASVAAGVGVERLREVLTEPQSGTGQIVPYVSAWVAVATLADVVPGKIKQFSAGGIQGVVFTLHGEVRALSATCTHQGCTLVPMPAQGKLECPCHPVTFALTGDADPGAYRLNPLPTIRTRLNADKVEVLVPAWD
jgi:nitrite reductase/ring-hydroxylating ferredoxin subunit